MSVYSGETMSSYGEEQSRRGDALRYPADNRLARDPYGSSRTRPMPPPGPMGVPRIGMSKTERADNLCNQLATRIVGGISLFLGLILLSVGAIIFSTPCCGDAWSNENREDQCVTGIDGETADNSCRDRNFTALALVLASFIFMGVGTTVVIVGECVYDVNDDREEDKVENFARMVKQHQIEMDMMDREARLEEKERRRFEKERSIAAASEVSYDRERTERLDNMRRYSIGNPSTPSYRQQDAYYNRSGEQDRSYHYGGNSRANNGRPQVVASQPMVYGNSRPAYAV